MLDNPLFDSLSYLTVTPPRVTKMIKELTKLVIIHKVTLCKREKSYSFNPNTGSDYFQKAIIFKLLLYSCINLYFIHHQKTRLRSAKSASGGAKYLQRRRDSVELEKM